MRTYAQYCPVARTAEVFAERWTPIIVRNLLAGCRTFGELREGAPGIPKALLVDRLAGLVRAGVVVRRPRERGRGWVYELTEKGRGLQAVCDAMGEWGARWLEIEPEHLDPTYAVWATARLVDLDRVPAPAVTVRVDLRVEAGVRTFWMLLAPPRVEVCSTGLGRTEELLLCTDPETLVSWNLRRTTLGAAVRAGRLRLEGTPELVRSFPTWVRPSPWASVTPAEGSAVR